MTGKQGQNVVRRALAGQIAPKILGGIKEGQRCRAKRVGPWKRAEYQEAGSSLTSWRQNWRAAKGSQKNFFQNKREGGRCEETP